MHTVILAIGALVLLAALVGFFRSIWRPNGSSGESRETMPGESGVNPGSHDGHGSA